jgi:hypothetical protein
VRYRKGFLFVLICSAVCFAVAAWISRTGQPDRGDPPREPVNAEAPPPTVVPPPISPEQQLQAIEAELPGLRRTLASLRAENDRLVEERIDLGVEVSFLRGYFQPIPMGRGYDDSLLGRRPLRALGGAAPAEPPSQQGVTQTEYSRLSRALSDERNWNQALLRERQTLTKEIERRKADPNRPDWGFKKRRP